MRHCATRFALLLAVLLSTWRCGGPPASAPTRTAQPDSPVPADDAEPSDDEAVALSTVRSSVELQALLPSDGTGCAPGARCIRVSANGRPQSSGTSVAQCRGEFADFIVPRSTIPSGYSGPWFQPNLIEQAHAGVPTGARPWRAFDPRQESQRVAYLLALRNYAFASAPVRGLPPQLPDADYMDAAGGAVPANQRAQRWFPAPRMLFGDPGTPGSGAREAAQGMTAERTVGRNELGGNTSAFRNYAHAYYDARGARTYARVWNTSTPGVDAVNRQHMKIAASGFVFKLLYSAARPDQFPPGEDILEGSLALEILPNRDSPPVRVRLLQIDIAVRDDRAGATGWYFATYAYDRSASGTSVWRKMVPLGLMWGNDPQGPPIVESWINGAAPAYARAHLGVDGRLNGPVDNPVSTCMSCHGTAQAPSLADFRPPGSTNPCFSQRSAWFRNLPGTTAFGRFDPEGAACETALNGVTLTAADYSLQLSDTVSRAVAGPATFNPCTWNDDAVPPAGVQSQTRDVPGTLPRVFPVAR